MNRLDWDSLTFLNILKGCRDWKKVWETLPWVSVAVRMEWFNQLVYAFLKFFHHQDGLFLRPIIPASKPSGSRLDICASPQSPSGKAPSSEKGDLHALLQKTKAERDDSQTKLASTLTKDCLPGFSVTRDDEGWKESPAVNKDGVMESTGDSTTLWSSLEPDMNCGHSRKG